MILAEPLRLPSGHLLPNRLAKSAMSECLATRRGEPSAALERLYTRFEAGGTGLLITGNVMIRDDGVGEAGNVVARPGCDEAPWRAWAAATKGRAFMQINHAGRQAPWILNRAPVAPSAVPIKGNLFRTPRALATEEVEAVIAAFADTARLAQRTGFAGVQLHGAHGYLISQFLSPLTNLRTDRYGGDLEARMRFLVECYRAVRAATGPEAAWGPRESSSALGVPPARRGPVGKSGAAFPVALKLNSADFLRGGFAIEESAIVARTLSEEGLDLLEVSGGTYETPEMITAPSTRTLEREAHFLESARIIRRATRCPIMLTGGIRTPAVMARIVEDGSIDVVGLARPLALEPDLPREILAGRQSPALCRPPPPQRGLMIAAARDAQWYQHQLSRMGQGLDPDPTLSDWRPLLRSMWAYARAA